MKEVKGQDRDKALLITANKIMECYTNKVLNEIKRIEAIVTKSKADEDYRVSILAENKFLNERQEEYPSIMKQLTTYKYWAFGLSGFVVLSIVIAMCAMIF